MSDTETPAALEIPARALAFHDRPHRVLLTDADFADRIRDVAAPVVAAELRRLAATAPAPDTHDDDDEELAYHEGLREMARRLRARADELDPA